MFEDLESCGRWVFTCDSRGPCGEPYSRVGWSKDIGLALKGESRGGLEGGSVVGLIGMWKYFVVLGKSMVAIGARDLVCVGG